MQNIVKIRKLNNNVNDKLVLEKVESQLDYLVKGQEVNQQELRLGFIVLANQNQELLDLNRHLSGQLNQVVAELEILKKEREEKEIRKKGSCKP